MKLLIAFFQLFVLFPLVSDWELLRTKKIDVALAISLVLPAVLMLFYRLVPFPWFYFGSNITMFCALVFCVIRIIIKPKEEDSKQALIIYACLALFIPLMLKMSFQGMGLMVSWVLYPLGLVVCLYLYIKEKGSAFSVYNRMLLIYLLVHNLAYIYWYFIK
jgi:hypothetical protein